jgi:hypothetical protein
MVMNLLAVAAACVGLAQYFTNAGTTYFKGLGTNPTVIGAAGAAITALLIWTLIGEARPTWKDILPIAAPALLMFALLTLVNSRVNGIAAIMTFENNAANMADLQSALVAIGALAAAALLACLAAFFSVKK